MSSADGQRYIVCPFCHKPNPIEKVFCQYCWSRLGSGTEVSSEDAREILRPLQVTYHRRKRIKLFAITIGSLILAAVIAVGVLYNYTDMLRKPSHTLSSNSLAGQWAMFRHDLLHSGATGLSDHLPQGKIQWTFATNGAIQSSPAIVDGLVYFGSRDGKIYALNATSGIEQWEYQTGSWVDSSPIIVDGIVYFGSNDSNMYALDARTGEKLWSFKTPHAITSSPAVAGGAVYFGSEDYNIYALDKLTGRKLWKFKTGGLVTSSPTVDNGIVYVGSSDGFLYALDARNGRFRLRFKSSAIISSPIVNGKIVYLGGSTGYLFAVSGQARNWPFEYEIKPLWIQLWTMGMAPTPPPISGMIWGTKVGKWIESSPAVVNSKLYIGVKDSLIAFDIQNNIELWSFKTGGLIRSSPAVISNTVYIGSDDGRIYAVDATSGKELWNISTGDAIGASPALANGILYIGSYDGKLYAIK